MGQSLGVDAHVSKQVKAPIIRLNLAEDNGQALLWRILDNPRVVRNIEQSTGDQALQWEVSHAAPKY